MRNTTFNKWSKETFPDDPKFTHELGGYTDKFFDEDDDLLSTLTFPNKDLSMEMFFSAVSAYLKTNDNIYSGCGFGVSVESPTTKTWINITKFGREEICTGSVEINSEAIHADIIRRVDAAVRALDLDVPFPKEEK